MDEPKIRKAWYKNWWLWMVVVIILIATISNALGNDSKQPRTDTQMPKTTCEPSKFDVKVLSSEIQKDYAGEPILIIEYEFTNHTNEAKPFKLAVQDKVYQHGLECCPAVVSDRIDAGQKMDMINPKTPYKLKVGYKLLDTKTKVNVEISELFGTRPFACHEIELK